MRRLCFLIVGVALAISLTLVWRQVQRPKSQTLLLADGSQLTLLKVTYGKNHVLQYGTGWGQLRDWFLVRFRGATLPPRRATFNSADTNSVMLWLRHDPPPPWQDWPPFYFLTVADENDLESRLKQSANVSINLRAANATRSPSAGVASGSAIGGPSLITGRELPQHPRRAKVFKIRLYRSESGGSAVRVGELTIRNPASGKFPTWPAETLPARRRTNELEITLLKLETGLTGKEVGHGPAGDGANSFSRATFTVKENGAPTEKWSVCGIRMSNAAGEVRPAGTYVSRWERAEHKVDFEGALWLEETAWKLEVDLARTGDFPADELWFIKGAPVPQPGDLEIMRAITNLHYVELEFLGVSGAKTVLPADYAAIQPHANLHVRTPHPLDGVRLALVEVRDDQGRKLATQGSTARTSMGGRGNTPREMLHGFAIEIPEDAKSLDITLAATRIVSVEFLAKPALTASARGN